MIAEGLQELREIIERAKAPVDIGIKPNDPTKRLVFLDGRIEGVDIGAPLRRHTITTLKSFGAAFERYSGGIDGTVWVSLSQVVCIMDDENDNHRADILTMAVFASPVFATLENIGSKKGEPKILNNIVRNELRCCDFEPERFKTDIQKFVFRTTDTLDLNHGRAGDSLGNAVHAEVAGVDEIPDEVVLSFHPFPALEGDMPGSIVDVQCVFTMYADERHIRLAAAPGSLERAKAKALEMLQEAVRSVLPAGASVFCGSP